MKSIHALFILALLAVLSCASRSKTSTPVQETDVVRALGAHLIEEWNESKTYVLYKQSPEGDHAAKRYKYAVVRKSDNKIVFEGTYQFGYVKWINDSQMEVLSQPSAIEQNESQFKKVFTVVAPKS